MHNEPIRKVTFLYLFIFLSLCLSCFLFSCYIIWLTFSGSDSVDFVLFIHLNVCFYSFRSFCLLLLLFLLILWAYFRLTSSIFLFSSNFFSFQPLFFTLVILSFFYPSFALAAVASFIIRSKISSEEY